MRLGIEYIAAFLDCDGTVVIVKAKKKDWSPSYYGKVCFYSQNLAVLEDIKETVGGSIPPIPSGDVFNLQLNTRETLACLRLVLPYLRIKREQALTVFALHDLINSQPRQRAKRHGLGGSLKHDQSVLDAREAIYLKIRELNKRDSRAFRTNRLNSAEVPGGITPSQATAGEEPTLFDSVEGVTATGVSPNDNPLHEEPARKGRHSLSSTEPTIQ